MDNFKSELQVFSPKIYLIAIVVGVTLGTCILFNLFFGVKTEAGIWEETSVKAIYTIGELQKEKAATIENINALIEKLRALEDERVNAILD